MKTYFFAPPKGAGHGHNLFTVAVFRRSQQLEYYRSPQKTLGSRIVKITLQADNKLQCLSLQKKGRGTDPVVAVFTQCFQSWRCRTEAESSNCKTISPDVKRLKHSTHAQEFAGETSLLKLHYQIRLSGGMQ